jgi:hypothetical protein
MRKGTAVQIAGLSWFYRSVRGSIGAAAIVSTWDVVHSGSILMSSLVSPIWILVSLLKCAIHPGWGLALARILIPVLTIWLVRANNTFQLRVAETNGRRIVAACEEYHAANGRFPRNLDELMLTWGSEKARPVPFSRSRLSSFGELPRAIENLRSACNGKSRPGTSVLSFQTPVPERPAIQRPSAVRRLN